MFFEKFALVGCSYASFKCTHECNVVGPSTHKHLIYIRLVTYSTEALLQGTDKGEHEQ